MHNEREATAIEAINAVIGGKKIRVLTTEGVWVDKVYWARRGALIDPYKPNRGGHILHWLFDQKAWSVIEEEKDNTKHDHHESSNMGGTSVSAGPLSVGDSVQSQPTTAELISKTYSELVEIGTANLQVYMDASKYSELSDMDDAMACLEKTTLQIKTLKAFAAEIGVTV